MKKNSYLLLLLILHFFNASGQLGEDTIIITNSNKFKLIGKQITFLVDTSSELTISDILKPQNQQLFIKSQTNIFSAPPSNSAFWFKFTVKNNTNEDLWFEAGGSYSAWIVDFYNIDSSGNYVIQTETGALRPEKNKEYPSNFYWLKLADRNDNKVKTYYVKIKSGVSPELSFTIGTIKSFTSKNHKIHIITFLFIGMMMIMFLYNLFLFFATKDSVYLSYVFYVFVNTICYTFNNNFSFFGDNTWWWTNHIAWQFIGDLSTIIFVFHFLHLKKTLPFAFKIFLGLIIIDFGIALLNLFGVETVVLLDFYVLISLLLIANTIFVAIFLVIKGNRNARFFLLSWSFLLFSIITFILVINGVLPNTIITRYSVYFGIATETLIFSFALADRLNVLRQEKEKTLKENTRLVEQHNIILEKEIALKTKELVEENKIKTALISEIHHRVKNNLQTISSLIYFQQKVDDNSNKGLKSIQNRVDSMSTIHEMLYSKQDITIVSLQSFIADFVSSVKKMSNNDTKNIKISYKIEDININISKAITMGLLVSEVISNSIKHAFKDTDNPEIYIDIHKKSDEIFFKIKDNGCGVKKEILENHQDSLGLKLINIFARQLRAKIQIFNNNGLNFQLQF